MVVVLLDPIEPAPTQQPGLPDGRKPAQPLPKPVRLSTGKEIATLEVRNAFYTNWTSIRVEQRVTQAFPIFQFECTEESPIPLIWDALQFVPGDVVHVYIGGVPAVTGYITERHVGFDEGSHGIRLIGCGDTVDLVNSSVPLEQLGGHDGKSWSKLALDLMAHLGIKLNEMGSVDQTPFQNVQIQPGETIMAALERYAKPRNIVIGSSANGGLLAIGEHAATPSGDLVEGDNILRANCVFRDQNVYKQILAVGQTFGGDSASGDSQNKQVAVANGSSTRNRIIVTVMDIADDMHGVQRRVLMERVFTEGSFIEASITVQGWFKNDNQSDDIWKAGEYYTVNSPSLILNNVVLGCAGCVYEQGEQGTTTTLQMVKPIHMNGQFNYITSVEKFLELQRLDAQRKIDEANAAAAAAAAAAANKGSQ
jgi:prophage tail gpP-like protein